MTPSTSSGRRFWESLNLPSSRSTTISKPTIAASILPVNSAGRSGMRQGTGRPSSYWRERRSRSAGSRSGGWRAALPRACTTA